MPDQQLRRRPQHLRPDAMVPVTYNSGIPRVSAGQDDGATNTLQRPFERCLEVVKCGRLQVGPNRQTIGTSPTCASRALNEAFSPT